MLYMLLERDAYQYLPGAHTDMFPDTSLHIMASFWFDRTNSSGCGNKLQAATNDP